jgi:hypothetical protein
MELRLIQISALFMSQNCICNTARVTSPCYEKSEIKSKIMSLCHLFFQLFLLRHFPNTFEYQNVCMTLVAMDFNRQLSNGKEELPESDMDSEKPLDLGAEVEDSITGLDQTITNPFEFPQSSPPRVVQVLMAPPPQPTNPSAFAFDPVQGTYVPVYHSSTSTTFGYQPTYQYMQVNPVGYPIYQAYPSSGPAPAPPQALPYAQISTFVSTDQGQFSTSVQMPMFAPIQAVSNPVVLATAAPAPLEEQSSPPKSSGRKGVSKNKKSKEPGAPKNPISAYLFFITEQRSLLAGKSSKTFADLAKDLGNQWKEMSEEEKAPYYEMAKKDKERFQFEKKAFDRRRKHRSSMDEFPQSSSFSRDPNNDDDDDIPFAQPV